MRIVFMGTPEISMTCLTYLVENGENIVGVVTREDKPKGRGGVLTPTPVKVYAESQSIPVFTPTSLKTEEFMDTLKSLNPDILVVVAYGKILPENVLNFPKYGAINLHVSLLPRYRGAAPMQRAVMNGEKETGITIMHMDVGLDTGDIIYTEKFPITKKDTFENVHDTSAKLGGPLLLKAIHDLENGTAPRIPQDDTQACYAAKIEKEDCLLDFTKEADSLDSQIRGLYPFPLAFTKTQDGKLLKIVKAESISMNCSDKVPGTIIETQDKGDGYFVIACGKDALKVLVATPEGKGKMTAGDLIRGRKIHLGDQLQ